MDIYRCFPLDYDFELARFRCAKNKASSKRLSINVSLPLPLLLTLLFQE